MGKNINQGCVIKCKGKFCKDNSLLGRGDGYIIEDYSEKVKENINSFL